MSYHEGSNWQARKEDEGKPLYDNKPKKKIESPLDALRTLDLMFDQIGEGYTIKQIAEYVRKTLGNHQSPPSPTPEQGEKDDDLRLTFGLFFKSLTKEMKDEDLAKTLEISTPSTIALIKEDCFPNNIPVWYFVRILKHFKLNFESTKPLLQNTFDKAYKNREPIKSFYSQNRELWENQEAFGKWLNRLGELLEQTHPPTAQQPHSPVQALTTDEEAADAYSKLWATYDQQKAARKGFVEGCTHKASQHPQQQAGRDVIRENIENALESTGQFSLSQCEQLAEIAMGCIPPSSVSNPVAFAEWIELHFACIRDMKEGKVVKLSWQRVNPKYDPKELSSADLYALFTSQPGE